MRIPPAAAAVRRLICVPKGRALFGGSKNDGTTDEETHKKYIEIMRDYLLLPMDE
jgi:hypothetical protein